MRSHRRRNHEPRDRGHRLFVVLIGLTGIALVVGLGFAVATSSFFGGGSSKNDNSSTVAQSLLPSITPTVSATTPTSSATIPEPKRHHPVRTITARPVPTESDVFHDTTIGIDPGHNGGNAGDTSYINHLIFNGRNEEACNTTGTETDSGYEESRYNFAVATDLRHDLERAGAHVVMTRYTNTGVGPCVNRRAEILNQAHVDVAVDIHADGGPASGRGFTVLEPVPDGVNDAVVGSSRKYAVDLRNAFEATGMPVSTYDGVNGLKLRDDLAGLNLTTVPEDLIECGNMRNAADAELLISPAFQHKAAQAIMNGMSVFLAGEGK